MKNLFLKFVTPILLGAFLLSTCQSLDCISGSGNQVLLSRDLGYFTKIETSGSYEIILKQDSINSLSIKADDNIQDEIMTRVSGNTLSISMEGFFCKPGPIIIYISSKEIEKVKASGAIDISSDGLLDVSDFQLELSGSSKVMLELNAKTLKTSSSGSSDINLKGQAGIHELELSGSSNIEALDFVVGEYNINSSGSSKSRINVLNKLNVRSSGSSKIEYKGKPSKISNHDSGSSKITSLD